MLFDNTSILLITISRGNIVELFKHPQEIKQDTHTQKTLQTRRTSDFILKKVEFYSFTASLIRSKDLIKVHNPTIYLATS